MTKPWEEEWEQDAQYVGVRDGKGIAKFWNANDGGEPGNHFERARLASKAPKMARALMGPNGKGHHRYSPGYDEYSCMLCAHWAPTHMKGCEIGDVLKEAGVLE